MHARSFDAIAKAHMMLKSRPHHETVEVWLGNSLAIVRARIALRRRNPALRGRSEHYWQNSQAARPGERPSFGAQWAPARPCSSPAVRQDNDAQNDRHRNDRGEPVHYAPIMHSGTVTRVHQTAAVTLSVKPLP